MPPKMQKIRASTAIRTRGLSHLDLFNRWVTRSDNHTTRPLRRIEDIFVFMSSTISGCRKRLLCIYIVYESIVWLKLAGVDRVDL